MPRKSTKDLALSDFGQWLKAARVQAGYTQESLANESGIPRITIARIESGETKRPQRKTREILENLVKSAPSTLNPLPDIPILLHSTALSNQLTYEEVLRASKTELKSPEARTEDDWLTLIQALRAFPNIFEI